VERIDKRSSKSAEFFVDRLGQFAKLEDVREGIRACPIVEQGVISRLHYD